MSFVRKSASRAIVAAALLIISCGLARSEPPTAETPPTGKWAQLVLSGGRMAAYHRRNVQA
jgi:hypothetical protein